MITRNGNDGFACEPASAQASIPCPCCGGMLTPAMLKDIVEAARKAGHGEPAAQDAPADEAIEEPELPYEEDAPPMDGEEQEPPPEGGDGQAPHEWQPVVAREAEAEPPAAVEALEDLSAGP
jgi:hypothetical protein